MEIIRANRQVAGKPCTACGGEILLGDEVVLCPKCRGQHHRACWEQRGACASPACAPAEKAAGLVPEAVPVESTPKRACPACGEQIPAAARMCPFCSESLVADSKAPRSFMVKKPGFFGGSLWNFAIVGDELVGSSPGLPEIHVPHDRGPLDVIVKKRQLIIVANGKKNKFMLADDIGPVVLTYWMTGELKPIPSFTAGEALSFAILGIFILQIILQPLALYKANQASNQIKAYPELLTGKGKVLAVRIIALTLIGLLGLICILAVVGAMMDHH
jgi:hypothetical protein